jgi:hypothetical protein
MRNSEFLDNPRPEDEKIGELFYENGKPCRIINGKKIYQLEQTEANKDLQTSINRVRASGMSGFEYLKSLYGPFES